jgi:hypothetical protein
MAREKLIAIISSEISKAVADLRQRGMSEAGIAKAISDLLNRELAPLPPALAAEIRAKAIAGADA